MSTPLGTMYLVLYAVREAHHPANHSRDVSVLLLSLVPRGGTFEITPPSAACVNL